MTRAAIALTCALMAIPLTGSAQDLTVDEMVALALERSPALKAVRTDLDVARGRVVEAESRPNLMVGLSRQEMYDGPDNQTMVEVQWPLELFRRSSRSASAKQEIDVTALSIADRERLVAASVREYAGRVLEAKRTLGLLEELLVTSRVMRDLMEARVKEGAAPRIDLDILRVELQRIEGQEILQAAQVETAIIELRALVGLDPSGDSTLRGDLEGAVRSAQASAPVSRRDVVESRVDVREAAARIQLAETRLEQARSGGRFDASVFGDYARMNAGFPQRAFDETGALVPIEGRFNNLRIGVMVAVPLWNRNQGQVAAASADRQRAEFDAEVSRLTAGAEVAVAEARERAARRAVELYGSGAREQARRNLEVVRESYQLGRTGLTDVLAEQRRYLDVEMAYTQALAEAYQARTALRRATGEVR